MTELYKNIKKYMKLVRFEGANPRDIFFMLEQNDFNVDEYYWIVRKSGSILVPSPHIFINGSTFNLMVKNILSYNDALVCKLELDDKIGRQWEGGCHIIPAPIMVEALDYYGFTPTTITVKIITRAGKTIEDTIPYEDGYYQTLLIKHQLRKNDVDLFVVTKVDVPEDIKH